MTSAVEPDPGISLTNVDIRRQGTVVLEGLNWQVRPGERWVILGPNGSGKTTLVDLIAGLLVPDSGAVEVDGIALYEATRPAWQARMASPMSMTPM